MWSIILFLNLLSLTLGYPSSTEHDPEEGEYFQGDMIMSLTQRLGLRSGYCLYNAACNRLYRWPKGEVYYRIFEEHFDDDHKNHILRGMKLIEEASCIRFYSAGENVTKFINITGIESGCFSSVGFQNKVQRVNLQAHDLDTGCFRLGTIVHEFLHSLGFYHQHSASDRDEFVRIDFENIKEGKEHNFEIYNSTVVTDFGIEYDYGSVMHYHEKAFSKNGEKTIIPLDSSAEIGQRTALSPKDISKLNIMYECHNRDTSAEE